MEEAQQTQPALHRQSLAHTTKRRVNQTSTDHISPLPDTLD